MNDATNNAQKQEKKPVRRAYHKPHLQVYGAVRELTAAGTGAQPESGSSSPNKQRA